MTVNRKMKIKKDKLWGQKKVYMTLIFILILGCFLGILFPFVLSHNNQELLKVSISSFFNNVMNGQLDYHMGLYQSLLSNFLFLVSIWLLGISIIGLPIVVFLLFYKGFIFGFSICSILSNDFTVFN